MEICTSGDVFQDKLYNIHVDIYLIQTYTNSIIVINEGNISSRIQ